MLMILILMERESRVEREFGPKYSFAFTTFAQPMSKQSLAQAFLQFVDASPSPFHAVYSASKMLIKEDGFVELSEGSSWAGLIKPTGKYVDDLLF